MSETVSYQPGMNLGRTFDLKMLQPGLDIFTEEALATSKTIERHHTTMNYSVIKKSKDVNNILGVSGEISLKVKAGLFNVQGMGAYLKEDRSKENTLEILVRAHVETMTVTMTDTNPKPRWNKNPVGSHYIRSITYGGDLIASIRIEASDSRNFEDIKAKVDAGIQVAGIINAGAKANFRKMEENLKSSSQTEISYYSTTLQAEMPRDIDGMLKALDSFKDQVMEINEGKGVPLTCEILPLSVLDPQIPQILRDKSLDVQLGTLEDNYDDVVRAKARLQRFLDLDVELNDDQEKEVSAIEDRLEDVLKVFNSVISNLDVTSAGEGATQMNQAFSIYTKYKKAGGYQREVTKFTRSVQTAQQTPVKDLPPGERLDLILVGKTGNGKSATGNSVFGEDRFVSERSSTSVTTNCQKESGKVGGREVCIVDTPGTMDTTDPRKALVEIGTAIARRPDGYHAFLFVLTVDTRMTNEERMAIILLKKLFGEGILKNYGILVFTHGDSFFQDKRNESITFETYIKRQGGEMGKLVKEVNYRCVLINNMEKDPGKLRDQVIELICVIDKLKASNNNKKYMNDLFEEAKLKLIEEERKAEEEETKRQELEKQKWQGEVEKKLKKEQRVMKEQKVRKEEQKAREEQKVREEQKAREEQQRAREEQQRAREDKVGSYIADSAVKSGRDCFPADVAVLLENLETVEMKDLRIGDKVLSSVSEGRMDFSEVYFFAHRDEHGISQYINVCTTKVKLKVSPKHHVHVVVDDQAYTVPSENIKVGDHILIHNVENNTLVEDVVTDLSTFPEVGVYAPITLSGTMVVNNVFVSCYTDYVVPRLSHKLLWPVRQLYRLSPSLSGWIHTPGKNGMPGWVRWCMDNVILPYRN